MFRRILSAALITVSLIGAAYATPGAVDKYGCHSHPRHCHSWSDISYMKNGRPYVPSATATTPSRPPKLRANRKHPKRLHLDESQHAIVSSS